jgi:hypothetical protein
MSQPTLITYANGMRSFLSYYDPRSWLSSVAHHYGSSCAAPWAERWYNRDVLGRIIYEGGNKDIEGWARRAGAIVKMTSTSF